MLKGLGILATKVYILLFGKKWFKERSFIIEKLLVERLFFLVTSHE